MDSLYILVPVGLVGALYLIRKIRTYQWGWVRNTYSLKDKIYIITGANTGLGFHTARALVKRGATVVICCRSTERANDAIVKIQNETKMGQLVSLRLDLGSFDSIRECAAQIKLQFPNFDCLINNAGMSTTEKSLTKENFEIHFGVNHLGHFLLFKLLEDNIRQNNSRVVVVASMLHSYGTINFDKLGQFDEELHRKNVRKFYSNSKLANFYFTRELYKRGFDAHTLCPGLCYTEIFRNISLPWYRIVALSPVILLAMRSAEQGAQNIIHAATDSKNSDEKNPATGYYIQSLKMSKSSHKFEDSIGVGLWNESLKMCDLKE